MFIAGCAASIASSSAIRQASARAADRRVTITIDDGPATGSGDDLAAFRRISAGIREAFVANGVPAIMFINERQLNVAGQRDQRIAVLEEWLDAGLELGNHTYSHIRLRDSQLHEFCDDVIRGEVISRQLLRSRGQQLTWFRYPYLSTGSGSQAASVESFLAERSYRIAPVTVDYKDYSFASSYSRYLRAGEQQQARELFTSVMRALDKAFESSEKRSRELLGYELPQILLIHCNEMNATKLPETIRKIRDRGYEFVSLDQAMRDPAYRKFEVPPGTLGADYLNGLQRVLGRSN